MMVGKWPGEVVSYDPAKRTARVKIDGLTDGADTLPEAVFEYALGDKSWHSEVRILAGDLVWLEFMGGNPAYPIITGYRAKEAGNANGWRKWHHANIQWDADQQVVINAGSKITLHVGGTTVTIEDGVVTVDTAQTTFTGAVTVQGPFVFQSGMTGQGGAGGGAAMTINGGATYTEDVVAAGVSVSGHTHPDAHGGNTGTPN